MDLYSMCVGVHTFIRNILSHTAWLQNPCRRTHISADMRTHARVRMRACEKQFHLWGRCERLDMRVCVCVRTTISHHIARRFYNLICGKCTCRHACTFRSCSCRENTRVCAPDTATPLRRPIGSDRENIEFEIMAGWQHVAARFQLDSTHSCFVFLPYCAGARVRRPINV